MAKPKVVLPGLFSRAAAAANSGDFAEAERLYRAILGVRPGQPEALHSLSVVRYQRGAHDDALSLIERLLRRQPDFAEAHYSRGTMLQNLGRFEAAVASFDKALALTPDYPYALQNRGASLASLKRFDEALASYDRLISLDRNSIDGHLGRGYALSELGRHAEALASYDRVLSLRPDHAVAHNVRGNMLSALRRYGEALGSFDRALSLTSDYAEAHLNRGNALKDLGRYEEALASYDRAPAIAASDLTAALNSRGLALQQLRRFPEALECFDRAIEIEPENADFLFNKALLLLLLGNFADGWREYEWRRKQAIWAGQYAGWDAGREWQGEDVVGKRIFLYTEQGLGDAIQFARFARCVSELGAEVSIGAPSGLDRLLRGLDGPATIVRHGAMLPPCDLHLPLMSVPRILGTIEETIPAAPYLAADPARVARWEERLRQDGEGLRVGFRWGGSATFVEEHHRSTAFERWRPVLETRGVRWYSLQTDDRANESSRLPAVALRDLSAQLTDFTETAAVIANLDLVITTDTSVAHLAGALGRPVWIAIKHVPDWRWLLEREDSPWYPSARLFRQRRAGDWDEVFHRIAAELDKLAASRPEQPLQQRGRAMAGDGLFNLFGNRRRGSSLV